MNPSARRVKLACYSTNISMAITGNLPALLFLTFKETYNISYTLLGLLILINFCTQLIVDLCFSFFSHKFNIPLAVKITPLLTVLGLILYVLAPILFPGAVYFGLVLGTVIFSAASGFAEVLISPVIAALPSKNPDHEMSKLHSVYAWGVVFLVFFATGFILLFTSAAWQILTLILAIIPTVGFFLFAGAKLPHLDTPERASGIVKHLKNKSLWISVLAIFLGGAAECTMAQWASGYLEGTLNIPKVWGDVFGVAMFAVMLGLGRTLYSKIGKHIERVLLLGSIGATLCYLIAAISPFPVLGLVACGLTGLCVSMLWPGSLIVSSDRVADGGVFLFAMMAAGGDLGASVGPQMVGVVTDTLAANPGCIELASSLGLAPEQFGMKVGMLLGMLFPLIAIFIFAYLLKTKKKAALEIKNN